MPSKYKRVAVTLPAETWELVCDSPDMELRDQVKAPKMEVNLCAVKADLKADIPVPARISLTSRAHPVAGRPEGSGLGRDNSSPAGYLPLVEYEQQSKCCTIAEVRSRRSAGRRTATRARSKAGGMSIASPRIGSAFFLSPEYVPRPSACAGVSYCTTSVLLRKLVPRVRSGGKRKVGGKPFGSKPRDKVPVRRENARNDRGDVEPAGGLGGAGGQ